MKNITKAIALCLALLLCLSFPISASALEVDNATIDTAAKGSLTIYKVDLTNAEKDGVWDSSYVSTGVYDQSVNDTLNNYALKDVEFTYLRVADVVQFTESTADGVVFDHVETLYGIHKTAGADLLSALGLANGANRYENADQSDKLDSGNYYYQSDVLTAALNTALKANATTVKNALETYVTNNGGTVMPLTDVYGKAEAEDLELGLYLVVETKVPEMVTTTCNPFFVSLPMTSVNGANATNGGTHWIYDVTVYPKNLTGDPTLDKTLREGKNDTGKHNGTSGIADGYAAAGTASDGDTIDYQIVSTLPSITSESTYLSGYTFADTLSKGITYNKNDVVLEFFTDAGCTQKIATWREGEGKFTVTYGNAGTKGSVMTVEMTPNGLKEINTSKAVYSESGMVNSGYSDCTLRLTYAATVNSGADVVYGDTGNPNEVALTWKRSSQDSYDTLKADAKVYTYGLELTKLFSDGKLDSFGYWSLTDWMGEAPLPKELFFGGLGLFTVNGIPKASYYALWLLRQLGNTCIGKGDGWFATKQADRYIIMMYNYRHFSHLYALGERFDMTFTDRYTPFDPVQNLDVHLTLNDVENGDYLIRESFLNRKSGSAFDQWVDMGALELNTEQELRTLAALSTPSYSKYTVAAKNHTLELDAMLEMLEVRLITIESYWEPRYLEL